ncbi:MAG: glycosyltransferase [Bacteroidia bacterium]
MVFFVLMVLVQLGYIWIVFGKLAFYKDIYPVSATEEPVSVIIAARNEYENLKHKLVHVLEQDYPVFEVIVVNDCSWDESQKFLEDMQLQYKHLKVSQLVEQEKYPTGKKFALTIGIKAAMYENLLFTDADCIPASNQWIRLMQRRFVQGKEIVLGFAPYNRRKGFLNVFIRFETLMTAFYYVGFAVLKNAFMGKGGNMAYYRPLFFKHKGFASHQHILSGNDDLFINQAATANNVSIELSPESFVYTDAKENYTAFSRQKSRHMTTGKYYKSKHKWMLGTFYASLLFFYISWIGLWVLKPEWWPYLLTGYGVRLICQYLVYYKAALRLKCTQVVAFLPVLDLLYVFYMYYFGTKGYFTRKPKVW